MLIDNNHQDEIVQEIKTLLYEHAMQRQAYDIEYYHIRQVPHILYKPIITKDGNLYCCLYGKDLQEGIAAFGETPEKACAEFDRIWMNG